LALRYRALARGRAGRVASPTFIPIEAIDMPGYALYASPTLYPGQVAQAEIQADSDNADPILVRLYFRCYGEDDRLNIVRGAEISLQPGAAHEFRWTIPDTQGAPIAEIGVELSAEQRADGNAYLDYLTWNGTPNTTFKRPSHRGNMWRRAWVNGVDDYDARWPESYRLVQNHGTGLLMQGTREWHNYRVSAEITPHLVTSCGVGVRVQGMRRYYALLLGHDNKARLVKALDGLTLLGELDFPLEYGRSYALELQVQGTRLQAWIDEQLLFDLEDTTSPLDGGGIALVCEEGRLACEAVTVSDCRK
ncbi:MAG: ADP-ribosylglycohydrolase family protein, partial [bacterium]|nr:ADP-ribosylglycohydrolase family protein [bacterium]